MLGFADFICRWFLYKISSRASRTPWRHVCNTFPSAVLNIILKACLEDADLEVPKCRIAMASALDAACARHPLVPAFDEYHDRGVPKHNMNTTPHGAFLRGCSVAVWNCISGATLLPRTLQPGLRVGVH